MTDIELADRIVALGVGVMDAFRPNMYSLGQFDGVRYEAKEYVRDWRVAGAMIEKAMYSIGLKDLMGRVRFGFHQEVKMTDDLPPNDSLPRAINEACAKELS